MIKHCRECGEEFEGKANADFCPGKSCRRDWNNRRQKRGAELYDLFMTIRHERSMTEELKKEQGINLWTVACQLASSWKIEDEQVRGGRRSYQFIPALVAQGKYVHLSTAFLGIDGTGKFNNLTTR